MKKLIFKASDVKRVVEHSLSAPAQGEYMSDFDSKTGKFVMSKPENPAVLLVHDDGVYLMSNGNPRDIVEGKRSFVAYAKGCNPLTDPDCWVTASTLVGGDDFAETLPWARELKAMIDAGAKHIIINLTDDAVSFVGA